MKLVITYRTPHGDDPYYTFCCHQPIEFESADALGKKLFELSKHAIQKHKKEMKDYRTNSYGKTYPDDPSIEIEGKNFDPFDFVSENSRGLKGSVQIRTLEDWFQNV